MKQPGTHAPGYGRAALTLTVEVDGRHLAVEDSGAPDGFPVFLMHGTPGSRLGPQPRSVMLHRRGIRLISYDRPGYGESTRQQNRRVADAAHDVRAIADRLGLSFFAVVGRSGGAPHALACAAAPELAGRVVSACAMVSLAPRDAAGLDWTADMTQSNQDEFEMATLDPDALTVRLLDRMAQVRRDPAAMLPVIEDGLRAADRRVIGDGGIRRRLLETYQMAFHNDISGHFDDLVALADPRGWSFQPKEVHVPTLLWHGREDVFSPIGHTRWLHDQIVGSRMEVEPEAAHFSAIEKLPEVFAWVVEHAIVPASVAARLAG
jgi:pimeloyl-ACP methyl ester carboxylesterase